MRPAALRQCAGGGRNRILLESILRIARHGRMIPTAHHSELVEITKRTVLRLKAVQA